MSNFKIWTKAQEEILLLNAGKHLVLAPPGSGKTDILGSRVTSAIHNGIKPSEMLCLTFTNRAARNMNKRVDEIGNNKPFIGTLHKFGYKFLLANQTISTGVTLLDEDDADGFLFEAIEEAQKELNHKGKNVETREAAKYVRIRNQIELKLINSGFDFNFNKLMERIADIYKFKKTDCDAIDFDDVLNLTLNCLLYLSPKKMTSYAWVQLDEVQDLSSFQWRIINELYASTSNVVFFGDYDQSIYSFMGALPSDIDIFTKGSVVHNLTDNFRSPKYLIDFFNSYASSNMPERNSEKMIFHSYNTKIGGSVAILNASGIFNDEVHEVVSKVIPGLMDRLDSSAILTRTNVEADLVSLELYKAGIKHDRVSGFDFFKRRVIKDLMAFLRAINNPNDRLAWTRLISIFGKVNSLRASRELVNDAFKIGIRPVDWLTGKGVCNSLDYFSDAFNEKRIVIFDTETTGLDIDLDDIIQIAAVELINGIVTDNVFEVYLKTTRSLDDSSKVHGITMDVLDKRGVTPVDGLKRFSEFVKGDVVVGHNLLKFDMPILQSNLRRHSICWISPVEIFDTLNLSRQLYPKLKNHRLATLIAELGLKGENTHNALDDVLATKELAEQISIDSLASRENRGIFIREYGDFISHFSRSFTPAWKTIQQANYDFMNLADLVARFFDFAVRSVKYEIKPTDQIHIDRLIVFLRVNSKSELLMNIINEYIPEFSTYSEADLITGFEKLVVSTIHKAKGLEFDGVVVTGCVNDIYPHYYSMTKDQKAEDARLLYVALSRAKNEIVISTHDTVERPSGSHPRFPSPFLDFISTFPDAIKI